MFYFFSKVIESSRFLSVQYDKIKQVREKIIVASVVCIHKMVCFEAFTKHPPKLSGLSLFEGAIFRSHAETGAVSYYYFNKD